MHDSFGYDLLPEVTSAQYNLQGAATQPELHVSDAPEESLLDRRSQQHDERQRTRARFLSER
jgi:hypothetical protein